MPSTGNPDPRYPRGSLRRQIAREFPERFRGDPVPIQDLAAKVVRRPSLVRRLLEEAGVRTEDESCLGMPMGEIAAAVATRYQSGVSIDRMSRDTGIDRRRINDLVQQRKAPLRTRNPLPADQVPWVVKQYQRGATLRALADVTGSSRSTIRRKLIDAGITLRGRHSACEKPNEGGRAQP